MGKIATETARGGERVFAMALRVPKSIAQPPRYRERFRTVYRWKAYD